MSTSSVVFLVDVDNTLLDNDGIQDDLRRHFTETYGARAWTIPVLRAFAGAW